MCFLCVCMFVLYVLVFCHFSLPLGVGAVCDCGTLWTFLFINKK